MIFANCAKKKKGKRKGGKEMSTKGKPTELMEKEGENCGQDQLGFEERGRGRS